MLIKKRYVCILIVSTSVIRRMWPLFAKKGPSQAFYEEIDSDTIRELRNAQNVQNLTISENVDEEEEIEIDAVEMEDEDIVGGFDPGELGLDPLDYYGENEENEGMRLYPVDSEEAWEQFKDIRKISFGVNARERLEELFQWPWVPIDERDANIYDDLVGERIGFFGEAYGEITMAELFLYFAKKMDFDLSCGVEAALRHIFTESISVKWAWDYDEDTFAENEYYSDIITYQFEHPTSDKYGIFGTVEDSLGLSFTEQYEKYLIEVMRSHN